MEDVQSAQNVGFFAERGATTRDVEIGEAIFAQDPPGQIYEMLLPRQARLRKEDGTFEDVVVVQAEHHSGSDDIVVGYRYVGGGEGVGLLHELEFY